MSLESRIKARELNYASNSLKIRILQVLPQSPALFTKCPPAAPARNRLRLVRIRVRRRLFLRLFLLHIVCA